MFKFLRISDISFILTSALFITITQNIFYFASVFKLVEVKGINDIVFLITIPLVIFLYLNIAFSLLLLPYIRRPLMVAFLLIGSAATYFIYAYNVLIDTDMVRNVFNTNQAETLDLISWQLVVSLVLFGVLPSLWVCLVKFKKQGKGRIVVFRMANILVSFLLLSACALGMYKDYASFFRNNRWVLKHAVPSNYIAGVYNIIKEYSESKREYVQTGLDAVKGSLITSQDKPTLLVIVLGETARSESYSLGSYTRKTNPYLEQQSDLFFFEDVKTCATSTATAVPCMFSDLPRTKFNVTEAKYKDNVLDIIYRTDTQMLWLENAGGCQGVCDRIPNIDITKVSLNNGDPLCKDGTCYDEVLLPVMGDFIDSIEGDSVLALHVMGSHGPSFYKRYPDEFRRFTPTCDTNSIKDCDSEALINTYDNTILYTDYILSQVIDSLKEVEDKFNIAFLYISDHGESLGEGGFYLHATPYILAPSQQLDIPLIMWFSDGYADSFGLDKGCIESLAQENSYSQDNLFHSLLGMMDIQTSLYNSNLDILQECRTTAQ